MGFSHLVFCSTSPLFAVDYGKLQRIFEEITLNLVKPMRGEHCPVQALGETLPLKDVCKYIATNNPTCLSLGGNISVVRTKVLCM